MTVLRALGKLLISIGCGVLLFVAWTLWGTGIYTAREQDRLETLFAQAPDLQPVRTGGGGEGGGHVGPPSDYRPEPGDPVFKLQIPRIDFDQVVVEGVDTEQLRRGPGHYPTCRSGFELCLDEYEDSPWPGEKVRVVVSGHRTTYGAPFWDLDKLEAGDEVNVEAKWGRFVYEVSETDVVDDADLTVVTPVPQAELVLTTCNPRFSAAERLIVYAQLKEVETT
ncbi:MAG TPA: sortase [Actinomycetota bacterium]|nr:sortase [Actinomycetota bacterium]